ncbi:pyridoxal 5'-phosphate synthase lyase subunit PdxS [Candidatus Pacearchaeota archaeon]|nr:pyridoxal 5'-phosphate synthase lyase subunit PdxS [Candidatus Pacearchaeota archaeon]
MGKEEKILENAVESSKGTESVKRGLAKMLVGGVIMDVTSAEQAKIAEEAGAVAVMALYKVPADIRKEGGVARMTDPSVIQEIMAAVTIPVMAKCRIGHYSEAQLLEKIEVDYIDESEVLTPVGKHIWKNDFKVPFVCGCRDLGEALRRIEEGASMIRTKGEAGTGDVKEAIEHIKKVRSEIACLKGLYVKSLEDLSYEDELRWKARDEYKVSYELVKETAKLGRLPVVNFAAGGIATPADAMYCMRLGVDGIFVGSGIFKSQNPTKRAKAIVIATHYFNNPEQIPLEEISNLEEEMKGIAIHTLPEEQKTQYR